MSEFAPINVAAYLGRLAETQPTKLAVAEPGVEPGDRSAYRRWTYAELHRESDRYAVGLSEHGIRRGMRTALLVKPSLAFFGLTFALFKLGAAPVLIDPGIGIRNMGRCLDEAEPEAFIGTPPAHLARLLLGWGRNSLRHLVTVGAKYGWGGVTLARLVERIGPYPAYPVADVSANEVAAILFTSGSTGPPKGAVYTHGMFANQVRILRDLFGLQPGEIDLCTFPLFALFAPALGWTAVIPVMDFTRPGSVDPRHIFAAIDAWSVTNLFGSPALLERLSQAANSAEVKLPTLRRVITAGAPVRPDILESFSRLLDAKTPIHTPYGATEALPISSISSQTILDETRTGTNVGKGNCVGYPAPGITIRIIKISDEPIARWCDDLLAPEGDVGEIIVQGPVVSPSYFHRPDQTALAKIPDQTGIVWHRMGDVGYFDDQGRLWFCGRKSQRVITKDRTFYTLSCEGVYNAHPNVRRTALVGVRRGVDVEPVLCIELRPSVRRAEHSAIRNELVEMGRRYEHTRPIRAMLFHPSFPVDIRHNAKISREKLAIWAARRLR